MDQLKGVGGWLGFLVFSLITLSPFANLFPTYIEISDAEVLNPNLIGNDLWSTLKTVMWCNAILATAILMYAGWRLWKDHRHETVNFAIYSIWIAGPFLGLVSIFLIANLTHIPLAELPADPEVIKGLLQTFTFAIVWTLYLKKSHRVANTYVKPFLK